MYAINHLTLVAKKHLQRFWHDERGVTATEYALIAAMVAAVLVIAVPGLTKALSGALGAIAGSLNAPPH